ncbi:hypothetical protein EDC04DRAFT_2890556 [Pisolithus marmoratus]|nr:hypothetical protein EDC04DRAFT_2890556 [Pisolithus marmoratus]
MLTPTSLAFAPTPTITMVDDVVLVDIEGFSSDWDVYTFSLNISSPSTKRIVLRVKHPEFHKHGWGEVKEPYAQPVQVENVSFENREPVKSEEITLSLEETTLKLEEPSECPSIKSEDSADCESRLQTTRLTLFPCTFLAWSAGNPQAKDDVPSKPWKYYLRSFDPLILPIEISRRREATEKYEDRLERETKRHRLV